MYSKDVKDLAEKYKNNKVALSRIKQNHPDFNTKKKLEQETEFLGNVPLRQKINHVLLDITEIPECELQECRNKVQWNKAKDNGYNRFCSSKCRNLGSNRKFYFSYDYLVKEHHENNKTIEQIAKENNCSVSPVYMWLKKHGIEIVDYKKKNYNVIKYLEDYNWLYDKYWNKNMTYQQIGNLLGFNTSKTLVWRYINWHGIEAKTTNQYDTNCFESSGEKEIKDYILSIRPDILINEKENRTLLKGYGIDIYLPEYKFAIEFNGLWSHSPEEINGKSREFHKWKTEECEKQGIQLFHIYETDWTFSNTKQEIWKSMISNKLGLNKRIYARKCELKEINASDKNYFLSHNHIQGKDSSNIKLGLFYDEKIVSVMTFVKSRHSKNYEWEISRFAAKKFINVVGGFSKLLKYFERNYNPTSIVSYADRSYSQGKIYNENGFELNNIVGPRYFYWKTPDNLYHRSHFRKSLLPNKLNNYDPSKTEYQNMINNGYKTIWDSGLLCFVKWYQ